MSGNGKKKNQQKNFKKPSYKATSPEEAAAAVLIRKKKRVLRQQEKIVEELLAPLFSIVVLCYKNTNLLIKMVWSIFQQDYPNIELIVSDDGSDDFNCEAVKKMIRVEMANYEKQYGQCGITKILVRKNEQNQKTVKHIAEVLPMTTGQYVIFTAADDKFSNSKIVSVYAKTFEDNSDVQWLIGRATIMSPDFKKKYQVIPSDNDIACLNTRDPQQVFSRWSHQGMAIPCCMAFRKESFELAGGIDESYTYLEDWPLVLHLLLKGYAPLYVGQYAAVHGAGGVTNSNDRYGVETRRDFYTDKYRLLNGITKKNKHLMSRKDKKIFRIYMREIMDRSYFQQIDMQTKSKKRLLLESCFRPIKFAWLYENALLKLDAKLPKKKVLALAYALILVAAVLFLYVSYGQIITPVFAFFAWMATIGAIACIIVPIIVIVWKRHIQRMNVRRKQLVN